MCDDERARARTVWSSMTKRWRHALTLALVSVQAMIDNVRSAMGSDTATLLLLDETRTVLEPAASAGLGGRWRGAPHIRVGEGFAGSVAARRAPVVIVDVNERSV